MRKNTFLKYGLSGLFVSIALFGSACSAGNENAAEKTDISNLYADTGVIMDDPGRIGDTVTITMQNGNMFCFENQDGDWMTGDLVSVLFDDHGTDIVYDDIILDYQYAGWISDREMKSWIK